MRTNKSRKSLAIAACSLALLGLSGRADAASAGMVSDAVVGSPTYKPIQPGVAVGVQPGAAYPEAVKNSKFGVCTLNFVFRGREPGRGRGQVHTYIGTAGHCMLGAEMGGRVGSREAPTFGTLVYRMSCFLSPCPGQPRDDDFALIRIDDDKLHQVSPVVRGMTRPPRGFTTSASTKPGQFVQLHGQGAPFSLVEPGRTQRGVLEYADAVAFNTTLVGPSHSGSPVVRVRDGKALGIIATPQWPQRVNQALPVAPPDPAARMIGGPTVERIMVLLDEAGFDVELVTTRSPR